MTRFDGAMGPVILAVVLSMGCGGDKGKDRPAVPPETTEFQRTKWTSHYDGGERNFGGATPREETLYKRIEERVQLHCQLDSRLRDTARAYGRLLAVSESEVEESDIDQLRFLLAKHGSSDYLIQAFVALMDDASFEQLVRLVQENAPQWTHCGVGIYHSGQVGRRVLVGVRRIVSLEPFPVAPVPGSRVPMRGRVEGAPGQQVRAFLGQPDGSVVRLRPVRVALDGTFETHFSFSLPGRHEIELLVEGERGAETAVLIPVFVGSSPDAFPTVIEEPQSDKNVMGHADALHHYLTQFRARYGLSPLERDDKLDALANSHSNEMAERDYFGHVSPVFGALGRRLATGGLKPERFAENVARSSSPYRIHRNLMRSPSHRINALDPAFSHVGIGVAEEGDDLIATQIFVRF